MKRALILWMALCMPVSAATQGQMTQVGVSVLTNCLWYATQAPSYANQQYEMYRELKAVPATAPIFTKFRITVVESGEYAPNQGTQPPTDNFKAVYFSDVPQTSQHSKGFAAGETNCQSHEINALAEMIALNDAAVDAVLTKYVVALSLGGTQRWPRP